MTQKERYALITWTWDSAPDGTGFHLGQIIPCSTLHEAYAEARDKLDSGCAVGIAIVEKSVNKPRMIEGATSQEDIDRILAQL